MINRIKYGLFSLLLANFSQAQTQKFTHLNIKEGLSQSSVKCIHQDSKGFIWAGTADGLNKYDGYEFLSYRHNPKISTSIPGNDITCIYETPGDSTLWIGTNRNGLCLYDQNLDRFHTFNNKKKSLNLRNIRQLISTGKTLWVATRNNGLCFFNPLDSSFSQTTFSQDERFKNITCLEKDKEGNLWFGTPEGVFSWRYANKFNSETPQFIPLQDSSAFNVLCLRRDIKGFLWIGTAQNGVYRIHPKSGEKMHFAANKQEGSIANERINDILERRNGEIWIGTASGLSRFQPRTNTFETYKNEPQQLNSLSNDEIYSLHEDLSGILWIGTYAHGMNKMDPLQNRFSSYNITSNIRGQHDQYNHVLSICTDTKNKLWIGSTSGLLRVDNKGNTDSFENPEIVLDQQYIRTIAPTSDGLLVAKRNRIILLDENKRISDLTAIIQQQTQKRIPHFHSYISNNSRQNWLGTNRGLLKCSQSFTQFELLNPKRSDGTTQVINALSIGEDRSGTIWLGTFNGELYSFDKYSKEFQLTLSPADTTSNINFTKIFSVNTSIPGEIWLGTNLGLYCYFPATGKLTEYLKNDGLSNDVVYGVVSDSRNNLWCSTNLGVTLFNRKTKTFQHYTYQDGLQSNEFNQGAYFKDENGLIYFGGIEGISIFDPLSIKSNTFVPPVVINSMEIQHVKVTPFSHPRVTTKQIQQTSSLNLSYHQNAFSFGFTALSYSISNRNQYKYALTRAGEEEQWIDAGNSRRATYTNVSPGEYSFSVIASNSDGLFNTEPTSIKITITPPFWATWWFRLSITAFVGAIIYLFIRYRMRDIKRYRLLLEKQIKAKTEAIVKQKKQIENQNIKLLATNEKIQYKNKKINLNNKILNEQHQQLLRQRDHLLELSEKVEDNNQKRYRFFTSVSHELRTPLTLILTPLKQLVDGEKLEQQDILHKIRIVYTNASKLLLIVDRLLEFRKAETAKLTPVISQFDLPAYVQKCMLVFKELAKQRNVNLEFSCSSYQMKIWADQGMIEKTLFNLLSYCFDSTNNKGTIAVDVGTQSIDNREHASITIKFDGIVMTDHSINSLFERFNKGVEFPDSGKKGSGLELALTKKYIEIHKGNIDVRSEIGQGISFHIDLPINNKNLKTETKEQFIDSTNSQLLSSSIGDYAQSTTSLPSSGSSNAGNPSLLIIDPENDIRNYLTEILSEYYRVFETQSMKEGLSLAKSKLPDLIITELPHNNPNDYAHIRELKSEFKTCHLPILVLTSLAAKEEQMRAIEAGADFYLTKPFDLQHLLLSINNLIEGRKLLHKRYSLSETKNREEVKDTSRQHTFIKAAMAHIENHMGDSDFNVNELCALLNLSQPQCYRKIKEITGYSISEFLRNTRLKKAAHLLVTTDDKVNEVAYKTGFNDPNYFTKSFIKLYGLSPKQYAKKGAIEVVNM